MKDYIFGVQSLQEHILYVLQEPVHNILSQAQSVEKLLQTKTNTKTPDTTSVPSEFSGYLHRLYPNEDTTSFLKYLQRYKKDPLSKLVYLAMLYPNTMDYKCALVLLQIALVHYANGSGCINHCGRVMRFSTRDDEPRSNPDVKEPQELELRKVCDDFYDAIIKEVNKHSNAETGSLEAIRVDIRTIDQLIRKATMNLCKLVPYDFMKFAPTIFYHGSYHKIETGPRGGKYITPTKGKKVYI